MITPNRITDERGVLLTRDGTQPLPGSVVLTEGEHGTAWQLFFSDGLWHSTRGGRPKTWAEMTQKRNLVLVYEAPPRETHPNHRLFQTDHYLASIGESGEES